MVPLMNQLAAEAVSQLRSRVQSDGADCDGGPGGGEGGEHKRTRGSETTARTAAVVEMQELLSTWTLNIIGMTAFGAVMESGSKVGSKDKSRHMSRDHHSNGQRSSGSGQGDDDAEAHCKVVEASATAHAVAATSSATAGSPAAGCTSESGATAESGTAVTAAGFQGSGATARASSEVFTASLKMADLVTQRFKLMALPLYE